MESNSNQENGENAQQELEEDDETLKCIFLCEFHATQGATLVLQHPKDYVTKDLFDIVSRYVIPKVQLQRSFISVTLAGKKILGYPVCIDSKTYNRNAFYFNLCFAFAPPTKTLGYEPIIKKLAEYLLTLELSTKFLSQPKNNAQRERLEKMLTQVLSEINNKKMCILEDGDNILPLCVIQNYQEINQLLPHKAPVLLDNFFKYDFEQWDLMTLRIAPYINGFNHIARIAALADVSLSLVIEAVKNLLILEVVKIIPVFQYSNVYRPTPKLSLLAKCSDLQQRAIEACSKSYIHKAKIRDILFFFSSLNHGATLGELCVRFNPSANNINERKTVLFGLMESLIRPIYRYPVKVNKNMFVGYEDDVFVANTNVSMGIPISNKRRSMESVKVGNNLSAYYTGLQTVDEICCKLGLSTQHMEEQLALDKHVIVLLK